MTTGGNQCILVVDDNPFNREGLVLYLEGRGYATCQAGDGAGAIAAAEEHQPTGAIVDIVIPEEEGGRAHLDESVGLSVVRNLKQRNPSMGVVIFSAYDDRGSDIWSLVREGARGLAYLVKGTRPRHLLSALEQTLAGNVVLDPEALTNPRHLEDELWRQLSPEERPWVERALALLPALTEREMEVALRLANSQNLYGIAESLAISQRTVENHVTNVYSKLGLSAVDGQAPSLRKSMLLAKACMLYELARMREKNHD